MSYEIVRNATENVIKVLNKTKYRGESLNGIQTTRTDLLHIIPTTRGYEIAMYNDCLKFGGEEDHDFNDAILSDSLYEDFHKLIVKENKDIAVVQDIYIEKGYFNIVVKLKSETVRNTKLQNAQTKFDKARIELTDFNNGVALKISTQTSKKKTCPHCDSNIAVAHVKSHKCPVCNGVLYTATEEAKFKRLIQKIKDAQKELKDVLGA